MQNTDLNLPETVEEEEKVSAGTKFKIIAAFLIVGFAAYVAWWVQEPTDIKADLLALGQSQQTQIDQPQALLTDPQAASQESPALLAEQTAMATTEQSTEASTEQSTQEYMTQQVTISNYTFNPPMINVPIGGTVVWTNTDKVPHSVTGLNFQSGDIAPGQSYSFLFDQEGTFDYACAQHPQMTGTIIVGTGASENTQALGETEETALMNEETPTEQVLPELTYEPQLETATGNMDETTSANLENLGMGGDESLHQAALETTNSTAANSQLNVKGGKLAKSGPEDFLYLGLFLGILYLRRRKILSQSR